MFNSREACGDTHGFVLIVDAMCTRYMRLAEVAREIILNACGVVNIFNRGGRLVGRGDRAHGAILCRYLSVLAVSRASRGIQCNGPPLILQLRAH